MLMDSKVLILIVVIVVIVVYWLVKTKKPSGIVNDWNVRVKSAKFNEELFINANEEEKEDLIYYFTQKIRQRDNYGEASFQKMPEVLQVTYLINELETEVNNGGFLQFFTNSSGQYSLETLEALKVIGAEHNRGLLEKAFKILLEHNESPENLNEKINSKKLHESFNSSDFYENDELLEEMHKLDLEFYEYTEDISKLKMDFFEKSSSEFWEEIEEKYGS